jgi:hypothetical protein
LVKINTGNGLEIVDNLIYVLARTGQEIIVTYDRFYLIATQLAQPSLNPPNWAEGAIPNASTASEGGIWVVAWQRIYPIRVYVHIKIVKILGIKYNRWTANSHLFTAAY